MEKEQLYLMGLYRRLLALHLEKAYTDINKVRMDAYTYILKDRELDITQLHTQPCGEVSQSIRVISYGSLTMEGYDESIFFIKGRLVYKQGLTTIFATPEDEEYIWTSEPYFRSLCNISETTSSLYGQDIFLEATRLRMKYNCLTWKFAFENFVEKHYNRMQLRYLEDLKNCNSVTVSIKDERYKLLELFSIDMMKRTKPTGVRFTGGDIPHQYVLEDIHTGDYIGVITFILPVKF